MTYSLKKGLGKGLNSAIIFALALAAFAGFSDVSLWELVETYVKPILGSMTVAGALTMAQNYFKVKTK